MVSRGVRPWTLVGLVGAFLDLALAYLLLCASAFVFPASRFCSAFGIHLPCPCTGVLGFRSSSVCLHRLLVEIPARKIYSVQSLVRSKFPFGSVVSEDESRSSNLMLVRDKKVENGVIDFSGEKLLSSLSRAASQNLNDGEIVHDVKGKGVVVNQKQRSGLGIRRRRRRSRAVLGYRKFRPNNLKSAAGDLCPYCPDSGQIRSQIAESLGLGSGINQRVLEERKPIYVDEDETTCRSYELSGSFDGSKGVNFDSSSIDNDITDSSDEVGVNRTESSRIRMLEQALAEEKAARAALFLELEKERAASATAADEAMAMIFRLQEEKASIEMEVRQNERMMGEKFAYDEEEMSILKEILIRRERENFFLENEVEAYRQISSGDQIRDDRVQDLKDSYGKSRPVLHPGEYVQSVVPEINNGRVINDCVMEPTQYCTSMLRCFSRVGDGVKEYRENGDRECGNLRETVHDTQQIVHDVHVVNDRTEQLKNGTNEEEMGQKGHVSDSNVADILELLVNSRSRTMIHDSERSSLSAVHYERLKLDIEVEWLREMVRIVQEGKEKLRISGINSEGETNQSELLDNIQHQLQEIQRLRGPTQHASLPNILSKVKVEEKQ
ncbi:GTD-binding domain-containing protein, partial [Psidium guajava]